MKKLTSLQILMFLGFGLSSSIFCSASSDLDEAVAFELQSAHTEGARVEVLADLAELYPEQVELIIKNEADLASTFESIKNFLNKKNREIEDLAEGNIVTQDEVARLAVELADAQSMLENTIAKHRAKHKRHPGKEQKLKDALMKAQQGIKSLSQRAVSGFNDLTDSVVKQVKQSKKQRKQDNKNRKRQNKKDKTEDLIMRPAVMEPTNLIPVTINDNSMDDADEAIAMMDAQLLDDEVVVQSTNDQDSSNKSGKGKKRKKHRKNKNGQEVSDSDTDASVDSEPVEGEVVVQSTNDQDSSNKSGKGKKRKKHRKNKNGQEVSDSDADASVDSEPVEGEVVVQSTNDQDSSNKSGKGKKRKKHRKNKNGQEISDSDADASVDSEPVEGEVVVQSRGRSQSKGGSHKKGHMHHRRG